ncbi:hypothetical protein KFE98_06010 [bacterium SCSIO 12741]|nr:hypothetical protein KFE98_06010 [bacterium SCSIO 12741]
MKILIRALQLLMISAVLVACDQGPLTKYKGEVDSLIKVVEKAGGELDDINPEKYQSWKDSIDFDVRFLHATWDTMPLEKGVKVDTYYRTKKSILKYDKTWKDQSNDIKFSLKQLQELRMDLESGAIDTLGFKPYFESEKAAINRLMESNISLKAWAKSIEKNYNGLRPEIQAMMAEGKQ